MSKSGPLYLTKRTSTRRAATSHMGQKRSFRLLTSGSLIAAWQGNDELGEFAEPGLDVDTTTMLLLRSRKLLGFCLRLENVWSDVALGECLAKFQPHECTGGVARCRIVIAFFKISDHREIRVAHQRI